MKFTKAQRIVSMEIQHSLIKSILRTSTILFGQITYVIDQAWPSHCIWTGQHTTCRLLCILAQIHTSVHYTIPTKRQEIVVIVVPDLDIDNVKIYSTCLRRDGIFIGIFFVMPLGIGICLSAVIYFACFRRRLKQSSLPYSTLQNDVSYNTSVQYATFHQASTPSTPPSSYCDTAPPSYEEWMKPNKRWHISLDIVNYWKYFVSIMRNATL